MPNMKLLRVLVPTVVFLFVSVTLLSCNENPERPAPNVGIQVLAGPMSFHFESVVDDRSKEDPCRPTPSSIDSNGRLFTVSCDKTQIHIYSHDGDLVRTLPSDNHSFGHFRRIQDIAHSANDSLLVFDRQFGYVFVFDRPDADPAYWTKPPRSSGRFYTHVLTTTDQGIIAVRLVPYTSAGNPNEGMREITLMQRFDGRSRVLRGLNDESVDVERSETTGVTVTERPRRPRSLVVTDPQGRLFHSRTDERCLSPIIEPDGDRPAEDVCFHGLSAASVSPRFSEKEGAGPAGSGDTTRQREEALFRSVLLDTGGIGWFQRLPEPDQATTQWLVTSKNGNHYGSFTLPQNASILGVRRGRVYIRHNQAVHIYTVRYE